MNIVVFDLETNGAGVSPNTESIIAISAVKMVAGCLTVTETFDTLILSLPPVPGWVDLKQLREAPSLKEALLNFSRFVGDALVIAERCPSEKMPFLYEASQRRGLPMREMRVMDSGDLARKLWGDPCLNSLYSIEKKLRLSEPPARLSRLAIRAHKLGEAVQLMWRELSPDFTQCPVTTCTGYLPDLG